MANNALMTVWDVQHGLAIHLKAPNGKYIVFDMGAGSYSGQNTSFSPLNYLRRNLFVSSVDYMVITHPHRDHIDDILNFDIVSPKILHRPRSLSNEEVMEGVLYADRAKFNKYCEVNNRYSSPIGDSNISDISHSDNYGGLGVQIFTPLFCSHNNFNNFSLVSTISYAGIKIVIPGDNENESFEELLADSNFKNAIRNADVLIAPHHGRESGYHKDFINTVNPRITIVSDGSCCDSSANNRYSAKSRGWGVYDRFGRENERYCLSTNSDGNVKVEFGFSLDPNYNNILNIRTQQ